MFTLLFLSQPSDLFLFAYKRSGSRLDALHLCSSAPFIPCPLFFSFQLVQQFYYSMLLGSFLSADTSKDKFTFLLLCLNWICRLDTCCVYSCLRLSRIANIFRHFIVIIITIIVIIIIDLLHKRVSPLQEVQAFSCINLFLILLIAILFLILSEIYRKTR